MQEARKACGSPEFPLRDDMAGTLHAMLQHGKGKMPCPSAGRREGLQRGWQACQGGKAVKGVPSKSVRRCQTPPVPPKVLGVWEERAGKPQRSQLQA